MVEVRLDTDDHERYRSEHFVAVRIGEALKMTKLASTRNYRFPTSAVGERKYGKVEVYKRVGSCAVSIDGDAAMATNEYRVKLCGEEEISFKVAISKQNDGAKPEGDAPTQQTNSNSSARVAAARSYLEKHHLEVRIADAMQAVLRERPEDPGEFLVAKLRQNASLVAQLPKPATEVPEKLKSAPPPEVPEKLKSAPPPEVPNKLKSAPPPEVPAQIKSAPSPQDPQSFTDYYGRNLAHAADLSLIHSRFPKSSWASTSKPASLTKLESRHFHLRQSVGTWLSKAPVRTSVPDVAPRAVQAAPRPAAKAEALLPFSTYYGAHLKPKGGLDVVHARFPAARRDGVSKSEPAGTELKAAAAPKAAAGFGSYYQKHLMPGSGLEAARGHFPAIRNEAKNESTPSKPTLPLQTQTARPFKTKPSVGTWLVSLRRDVSDAAAPAVPQAPAKVNAPFAEYYSTHFRSPGVAVMDSLNASFTASSQEKTSPTEAAKRPSPLPSAVSPAGFKLRPSVGTWLQRRAATDAAPGPAAAAPSAISQKSDAVSAPGPATAAPVRNDVVAQPAAAPVASFTKRPSVGSWLAPRLQERLEK